MRCDDLFWLNNKKKTFIEQTKDQIRETERCQPQTIQSAYVYRCTNTHMSTHTPWYSGHIWTILSTGRKKTEKSQKAMRRLPRTYFHHDCRFVNLPLFLFIFGFVVVVVVSDRKYYFVHSIKVIHENSIRQSVSCWRWRLILLLLSCCFSKSLWLTLSHWISLLPQPIRLYSCAMQYTQY